MPMLPLARALADAQHDVGFCSAPHFELPARHGFAHFPVGPDWTRDAELVGLLRDAETRSGAEHAQFMLREIFARASGVRCLPDLADLIGDWRPDVVIAESTELAAQCVAEKFEIPHAIVTFGVDIPIPVLRVLAGQARDALRAAAGLDPDPEFEATRRYLRLNFAPPAYQPVASRVSHAIAPAVFDPGRGAELPDWVDALPDRPVVYATLGTVFNHHAELFERIADGLRDEPVNLIVTVGLNGDPSRLEGYAENLKVARFIPNSLLLPRCSAVVSHAGYGTVMGCLTHGIPMLLLPLGADHQFHANRCRELAVATVLEVDQCTPERVRAEVRGLLSNPISPSALRDEIALLPGMPHAVELIERLAQTGEPIYND